MMMMMMMMMSRHRLLTDAAGAGSSRKKKASLPTHHTLPSNLESLSLEQLKSVAASHGITTKGSTKADVLASIEKERFRDEPSLRITMTVKLPPSVGWLALRDSISGASRGDALLLREG